MNIAGKLRVLKRRFPRVTSYKFGYKIQKDLSTKYNKILMYMLIFDEDYGHSIMPFSTRNNTKRTVTAWRKSVPGLIEDVFIGRVLQSINRSGQNWIYRDLIIWTGGVSRKPKKKKRK